MVSVSIKFEATLETIVSGVVPGIVEENNFKEKEMDAKGLWKSQHSQTYCLPGDATGDHRRKSMFATLPKFCNYCGAKARGVVSFQQFAWIAVGWAYWFQYQSSLKQGTTVFYCS